jgi:hypothetical protein
MVVLRGGSRSQGALGVSLMLGFSETVRLERTGTVERLRVEELLTIAPLEILFLVINIFLNNKNYQLHVG